MMATGEDFEAADESRKRNIMALYARAKVDRGEPLEPEERHALNDELAEETYKLCKDATDEIRRMGAEKIVNFTQGDFDSVWMCFHLVIIAMFQLSADHSIKREAAADKLQRRIEALETELRSATPGNLKIKGTHDPAKAYAHLDVVAVGGASFMARRDNPGACPGDGWQMIAAQGKRGQRGPRVERMTVDGEGLLTLFNSDGSTVKVDLYPVLAKVQRS